MIPEPRKTGAYCRVSGRGVRFRPPLPDGFFGPGVVQSLCVDFASGMIKGRRFALETLKTKQPRVLSALPKKIVGWVLSAGVGAALGAIRFEGAVSPFSPAFAAGAPPTYVLPAAVGGAVGAVLFQPPTQALKYAGALTLVLICRIAYDHILRRGREILLFPLFSFLSVLVSAAAVGLAQGTLTENAVITLCEALIAGTCTCFFYRAFTLFPSGVQAFGSSAGDMAAILLSGSILLLALDTFRFGGFSPAHVVSYFAVLLLSCAAGQGVGAAAGIAAGLVLGYAQPDAFLVYFLPAAGLLCGIAAPYGRLVSAGVFSVLGAMFAVLKGAPETALVSVLEIAGAALLFALLPGRAVAAAAGALRPLTGERYAAATKSLVQLRLRRAAKAVRDVSDAVQAVCRLLKNAAPDSPADTAKTVQSEVCAGCLKKEVCWGACRSAVEPAFRTLADIQRKKGSLTREDLPNALRTVCRSQGSVLSGFERVFCELNARRRAKNEVYDIKSLAAAQFGSVASMLEAAADDAGVIGETDPYLAALAKDVLAEFGFGFSTVSVSADAYGHALLEVYCTRVPPIDDMKPLLERLRAKTNVSFMPPVQDEYKKQGAVLSFCEQTPLQAEFCFRSAAANGENLCGDTVEAFPDGRGAYYCVLSDGMGTGKTAAVDSVMTCSLFSRMMKAGFSPEIALEAVNCALMVKSEEESLATLDLMRLDLYTGEAAFYKAGGAFSVVHRGSRTIVVEHSSLPLGILRETAFRKSELTLSAGDTVLMFSDGAGLLARDFLKDMFYKNPSADAKTLAELALAEAVRRAPIGHADDITVACVRLAASTA